MEKLNQLRDALLAAHKALTAHGEKLSDDFSEDERTAWKDKWDALNADYDGAKQAVEAQEKLVAENNAIRERVTAVAKESKPTSTSFLGRDGGTITSQRLSAEDDPKKGFNTPREFLLSIMDASRNVRFDERLRLCRAPVNAAGADEQGTYSDPYGGFLIPAGFMSTLLAVDAEDDPTANLTMRIPMETPVLEIPARVDKNHTSSVSGGLQVYRRGETDTVKATRMEVEQVKLQATSLFGIAYATEELLDRSPMSFVALLQAGFRDEFRAKRLSEILGGTGAGQYEGVLNAACTVSVAKETGQAAATILKENIDNMRSRCWGYGRAVWLYNHDCLPQLRSLVQTIGTGGSTVPYFTVAPDGTSMLDGRPAYPTEFCETLGTVGDLVLANFSQYLEGTLTGPQQDESIHVRFINHERTFKFWMENDGRPWWRSALTPRKSSSTLSPFVTLATRS